MPGLSKFRQEMNQTTHLEPKGNEDISAANFFNEIEHKTHGP